MLTRRYFVTAAGLVFAGLVRPGPSLAAAPIEIRMRNNATRDKSWYDPVGLHIEPGQSVRWILETDVHSAAAYHPKNANHSLRIPPEATPWDSGLKTTKGQHYDLTLTVEGVYDYFCLPHEHDGMVGRIIVGKPGNGPGTLPFDYYKGKPEAAHWVAIPPAARKMFPTVQAIMAKGTVHYAAA